MKNFDLASVGQYLLYVVLTVGGGYLVSTGHLTSADLAWMIGGLGVGHGVGTSVATKATTKVVTAAHAETLQTVLNQFPTVKNAVAEPVVTV